MANTFKRSTLRNVGTSATSVYTVPASTKTVVIGFSVANISNTSLTTTVALYDGVNTTNIVKAAPIEVGGTLVLAGSDQKIVLEAADALKVTSSVASSLDVSLYYMEIT